MIRLHVLKKIYQKKAQKEETNMGSGIEKRKYMTFQQRVALAEKQLKNRKGAK